jgi:hypothetical protein
MSKFLKMISLLSIVFGVQQAWSAGPCDGLNISYEPALVLLNTDNNVAQLITVSRSASAGGSCDFLVFIENNSSTYTNRKLTHGGNSVPIQFYSNSGRTQIIKSASEASSKSDALWGTLTGPSVDLYYYPNIDTSVSVPSGPYIDRFDFSLYSWNGNSFNSKTKVTTNASTNYKYLVDTSISLSLVDTGSPFNAADVTQDLDFGALTTGKTMGFDLILMYTNGYNLYMSSVNSGSIKSASSNTIPYTLNLNGSPVSLSASYQSVNTGTGSAPSGGTRLPVSVVIGNVGNAPSGSYTDTVSIKIAAP